MDVFPYLGERAIYRLKGHYRFRIESYQPFRRDRRVKIEEYTSHFVSVVEMC